MAQINLFHGAKAAQAAPRQFGFTILGALVLTLADWVTGTWCNQG